MNELINFEGQQIRQTEYEGETYFSLIDVVAALTNNSRPNKYWSDLKVRLRKEGFEVSDYIGRLKMIAPDGKSRSTDCANRETILRIIQSIPSLKSEPFKQWMAQVGEQRLQEINDPAKAMDRVRKEFRDLGYSDEWIETRIRTKQGRLELTAEWESRGIGTRKEFARLTATLSAGVFGVIPSDHKRIKGLEKENLRDHMTREELIFTELAEIRTKKQAIADDAQGFEENRKAAEKGGKAAGEARKAFEKETGEKVVSSNNFLSQIKAAKDKLLGNKDGE